jgi:flagellar biosynthesis protein FliQ
VRPFARRAFVFGTWLVCASVLIQVLLAGLGIFDYAGFSTGTQINGAVVFFLPLVVLLIGW